MSPNRWNSLLARRYLDVFDLVAKFYFYYVADRDLEEFIRGMGEAFSKHPGLETPQEHQKLNPINMFSNEVIRTAKLIKNEASLKHYLRCMRCFAKPALQITGRKTRLRLGDLLSDLATPGYPMYPTSAVKEEARQTLNILWPYGVFLRDIIRFSFRLLRPLSFYHWVQYRGAQMQSILANIWLWIVGIVFAIFSSIPLLGRLIPNAQGRGHLVKQEALHNAQRSQRLVDRLSSKLDMDSSSRRVRFTLPTVDGNSADTDAGDADNAKRSIIEDDEDDLIHTPTNRSQSPLRSPPAARRPKSAQRITHHQQQQKQQQQKEETSDTPADIPPSPPSTSSHMTAPSLSSPPASSSAHSSTSSTTITAATTSTATSSRADPSCPVNDPADFHHHEDEYDDDEEEEVDMDDKIDFEDLMRYVKYSADIPQSGVA